MPNNEKEEQKEPSEKKITLSEEEFFQKLEPKEKTAQFTIFRLSGEWYGVNVLKAKEVIKAETISYLPSSPEHIAGIVNIRGSIVSVTDLKKIFGLAPEELTEKTRLVVIESGNLETGILADEVGEIVEVAVNKIEPTMSTIAVEKAGYIEGECRIGGKLFGILNAEKILEKR